jgi:hypothetical protein
MGMVMVVACFGMVHTNLLSAFFQANGEERRPQKQSIINN